MRSRVGVSRRRQAGAARSGQGRKAGSAASTTRAPRAASRHPGSAAMTRPARSSDKSMTSTANGTSRRFRWPGSAPSRTRRPGETWTWAVSVGDTGYDSRLDPATWSWCGARTTSSWSPSSRLKGVRRRPGIQPRGQDLFGTGSGATGGGPPRERLDLVAVATTAAASGCDGDKGAIPTTASAERRMNRIAPPQQLTPYLVTEERTTTRSGCRQVTVTTISTNDDDDGELMSRAERDTSSKRHGFAGKSSPGKNPSTDPGEDVACGHDERR